MNNKKSFPGKAIKLVLILAILFLGYIYLIQPKISHQKLIKCVQDVGKTQFLENEPDPNFESEYEVFKYEINGKELSVSTEDPDLKERVDLCFERYGK